MTQTPLSPHDAKQYSPLSLAFLGDSVFDTLIREQLLRTANQPPAALHQKKSGTGLCRLSGNCHAGTAPHSHRGGTGSLSSGQKCRSQACPSGRISLCDRAGSVVWISLSDRCSRPHAGTDAADSANCRISSRFDGRYSRKSIERMNTHVRTF